MGKAVVLGGNGFIGAACVKALLEAGFSVTGVGRTIGVARQAMPGADWLARDITTLDAAGWCELVDGASVIVNAAGALQDGARDSLQAVHVDAVKRLVAAMQGRPASLVQISAAGVAEDAPTWFMRSKWLGDQAVITSALKWWCLRPVLVLGPHAYGGTALLRATAALPVAGLLAFPAAPVQTVHVEDVAGAVVRCASGQIRPRVVADITELQPQPFATLVEAIRRWLGYEPWRYRLRVPDPLILLAGRAADMAGWLGWRSPLRTSALTALRTGITGDAAPWQAAGGSPCRSIAETLASLPAGTQERWFARLYLLLPLAIAVLAAFWFASGVIGLWQRETAIGILTDRGFAAGTAAAAVYTGSLVDMALGAFIAVRRWAKTAALGMVAASAGYLLAAAVWTPDLWADPLGAMLKVLPGMVLAGLVAALMEPR